MLNADKKRTFLLLPPFRQGMCLFCVRNNCIHNKLHPFPPGGADECAACGVAFTARGLFFLQQVGAQSFCAFERLRHFPFLYFGVVSAQEYVGHFPALVVGRAGVHGRCQQVVLERVGQGALFVAQHARYEPRD